MQPGCRFVEAPDAVLVLIPLGFCRGQEKKIGLFVAHGDVLSFLGLHGSLYSCRFMGCFWFGGLEYPGVLLCRSIGSYNRDDAVFCFGGVNSSNLRNISSKTEAILWMRI